jgi:hypothetical protein
LDLPEYQPRDAEAPNITDFYLSRIWRFHERAHRLPSHSQTSSSPRNAVVFFGSHDVTDVIHDVSFADPEHLFRNLNAVPLLAAYQAISKGSAQFIDWSLMPRFQNSGLAFDLAAATKDCFSGGKPSECPQPCLPHPSSSSESSWQCPLDQPSDRHRLLPVIKTCLFSEVLNRMMSEYTSAADDDKNTGKCRSEFERKGT